MDESLIEKQNGNFANTVLGAVTSVVYNEDCVEALKRFADKHFDLAIVDPPYGIDGTVEIGFGDTKSGRVNRPSKWGQKEWDKERPTKDYPKKNIEKMRTVSKKDSNHAEIVKTLRAIGAHVQDVSQLKNCFDILVGYRGRLFIMEVKDGKKPPSARQLTPGEMKCKQDFERVGVTYHIVLSVEQAIEIVTEKA